MSLHKRGRIWHYEFRRGGLRFQGTTGALARREAEAAERREIARREAAISREAGATPWSLGEIATWFWDTHAAADRDRATTAYRIERIVEALGAATRPGEIDDARLARWVAHRRATPTRKGTLPAPATVNREIELLRRMLKRAAKPLGFTRPDIDWGELRKPEPRERVVEMTPAEEDALFAALRPDHRPLFRHYLLTGVRLSMATDLMKADLDLAAGWVTFHGKAAPGAAEPSRHALPVTRAMREIYLAALASNPTGHVFTYVALRTVRGHRHRPSTIRGQRYPYTASYVDTIWDRARARAALNVPSIARLRLHDLRHTFGSQFYRQTGDILATMRALGHTRVETTQKYAHVFDQDLQAAMRKFHDAKAPSRIDLVTPKKEGEPA